MSGAGCGTGAILRRKLIEMNWLRDSAQCPNRRRPVQIRYERLLITLRTRKDTGMWKKIAPALVVAALAGATALPAAANDLNNALGGALGGVAGAAVGGTVGGSTGSVIGGALGGGAGGAITSNRR
ncbi:TPA: hypothetical protein ACF6U4_002100, partial [Burkholderia multivorans]